jgi:hypothetical protein
MQDTRSKGEPGRQKESLENAPRAPQTLRQTSDGHAPQRALCVFLLLLGAGLVCLFGRTRPRSFESDFLVTVEASWLCGTLPLARRITFGAARLLRAAIGAT